ncbi:MAG: AraC family transcriptional regulator [Bacteroidetes bacterium]|nr:MAG: AraC family transcriptional regulator [Bacteroidota bacterium]
MLTKETQKEYKSRTDTIIDFILKNLNGDVSLRTLSHVANYSPFHLQKVFKQVTGQTPKQYVIKLRSEAAFHLILVHPHKSIHEVAMDCGFSSAAVFSRSMKKYFGISPERVRSLSPREHIAILKKLNLNPRPAKKNREAGRKRVVRIVKTTTISGIYLLASFNDPVKIQKTFKELVQLAHAHDMYTVDSKLYGILSPQHGHTYKAFLSSDKIKNVPGKLNVTEIKAGKYAVIKASGQMRETMKAVHYVFHKWLPGSGYRIADEVTGYEVFSRNPETTAYSEIDREIYIPVKPA